MGKELSFVGSALKPSILGAQGNYLMDRMKGKQGEYYQPGAMPELDTAVDDPRNSAIAKDISGRNEFSSRNDINDALSRFGSGQMDLSQALQAGGANQGQMQELLATNPMAAQRLASGQIDQDAILGRLYGSGSDSQLSRALSEEKDLSARGWSMKPEDSEAYGQASDEIARTSGAQEKMLAQAMANRGLSASQGAMSRGFAGVTGNKFEQLAGAQRKIAQDRMQTNMQRLQNVRNLTQGLGSQAEGAISGLRASNQRGVGMQQDQRQRGYQNEANAADSINAQRRALNQQRQGQWSDQQKANLRSQQDKRGAYMPGLEDSFNAGLNQSASSLGALPGKAATAYAGQKMGADLRDPAKSG